MRSHLGAILAGLVLVMIASVVAAQQPPSLASLDDEMIPRIASREDPAGFGIDAQVSMIPAFNFRPHYSTDDFQYHLNGYMRSGTSAIATWLKMDLGVGFEIPLGADLYRVCAMIYDGVDDGQVRLALFRYEQPVDASGTPFTQQIGAWWESGLAFDDGYDHVCMMINIPQVMTTYADIDGDGTEGHVSYAVTAVLEQGSNANHLRIGSVQMLWWRQISPAPATATFNDVPVGAFGFQHIEALAASGITAGCGGDNFCPDAALTRAQMAVFLAKALGLHYTQ